MLKLEDLAVAFTGKLDSMNRQTAERRAEESGARVAKSISSCTDVIVQGKDTSGSSKKIDEARDKGIQVWNEKQFRQAIREAESRQNGSGRGSGNTNQHVTTESPKRESEPLRNPRNKMPRIDAEPAELKVEVEVEVDTPSATTKTKNDELQVTTMMPAASTLQAESPGAPTKKKARKKIIVRKRKQFVSSSMKRFLEYL